MRKALLAALLLAAPGAGADVCMLSMWDSGNQPGGVIYPNWARVHAASHVVWICMGCTWAPTENIKGVTVVNFGTAAPSDIKAVYWQAACGATTTGLLTLTFAGTYDEDTGSYPAWTWAGTTPDFGNCADLCGSPLCGGYFNMDVYVDVGACPTPDVTLAMGYPTHELTNTTWWGSVWDNAGCALPWGDTGGKALRVLYSYKEGPDVAAPGDTVSFTVTYGRPGTSNLTSVVVTDTQPPYTHYVDGSAVPAPDAGYDPDFGPPLRLRWTILPPHPVSGGPTGQVMFSLSVDWGNGEGFEPGSGDVAAPEGEKLRNTAHISFEGITGCARNFVVTPQVNTTVRRFLFWKIGDNDMLFSQAIGQPADEMIYSMFIRNTSETKTWWNVQVWDSVPPELDAWGPGCGLEDPCLGWTMTPNGCPYAAGGYMLTGGGTTVLTWRLDMPPQMTLALRWKGQVKSATAAGATAVNRASLLEIGRAGIVNGTGHSIVPRTFTHLANIMLPTTYISYVGHAGAQASAVGFFLDFFPLNKKTQFELRGLQYQGAGFPTNGGISASIGSLIGDCLGGFPGGVLPGGGVAGCRTERIPAKYEPTFWLTNPPVPPFDFLYKLTSNSPVLWQMLTYNSDDGCDNQTFAPSSTMSYAGLIHYAWTRTSPTQAPAYGDSLSLINTGMDPYGAYQSDLPTTVHVFKFDYGTNSWEYQRTWEIDRESQVYDMGTMNADVAPWRTVSSDAFLIVNQGTNLSNELGCCCGSCANDNSAMMPNRETGNVVTMGAGTMYGLIQGTAVSGMTAGRYQSALMVGNVGTADAAYEISRYVPYNMVGPGGMPAYMANNSGYWKSLAVATVPAGFNNPENPRMYRKDGASFFNINSLGLYRVRLISGGPIQALAGVGVYAMHSGGAVLHSVNGAQTGREFWLNHIGSPTPKSDCGAGAGTTDTQVVNVFCPKKGMTIRGEGEGGYTGTYTTTGPDQCVAFTYLTNLGNDTKRNYRFTVLPGANAADAMVHFVQCVNSQKGYTAPFLQTGVHYQIVMPPVVFVGQSFWITVVVLESGGVTRADYNGITSFSGTDPGAKIEGAAMSSYDYTWQGSGYENGVKVFVNVTFYQLGYQSIVAVDTNDGSISGIATTMVVGADVKLLKDPKFSIASSGETIRFRICWSNYSSATAANFVITDAVPMGTSYVPEAASLMFCGAGGPAVPTVTVAYGTASPTTPAIFNTLTSPTQTAPANTRWLRWTIQDVYVYSTGCVCFRVRID